MSVSTCLLTVKRFICLAVNVKWLTTSFGCLATQYWYMIQRGNSPPVWPKKSTNKQIPLPEATKKGIETRSCTKKLNVRHAPTSLQLFKSGRNGEVAWKGAKCYKLLAHTETYSDSCPVATSRWGSVSFRVQCEYFLWYNNMDGCSRIRIGIRTRIRLRVCE